MIMYSQHNQWSFRFLLLLKDEILPINSKTGSQLFYETEQMLIECKYLKMSKSYKWLQIWTERNKNLGDVNCLPLLFSFAMTVFGPIKDGF